MQKIIFGIFAHPDDEAFGPCATLLDETAHGSELHLITLTAGAGSHSMNPDNVDNLAEVRLNEWHASTQLLGATSTHHLGYADGKLCNDDLTEIAAKIETLVRDIVNTRTDVEIEFITFDLNGLTGHIDHIVATRSSCLAFYRLRDQGALSMKRIRLYCLARSDYPRIDTGFVFMEPGRDTTEIQETTDARHLIEQVHAVMHCHHSQRADCDAQITKLGDNVAVDHFTILN